MEPLNELFIVFLKKELGVMRYQDMLFWKSITGIYTGVCGRIDTEKMGLKSQNQSR
jgi:hypothetical protein